MPVILAQMEQDGTIEIEPIKVGSHVEQRIVPKTTPVLYFFSADDLTYVDKAIAHFWEMTAGEASDDSHGVAWKTRRNLDPLPYESALLLDEMLGGQSLVRIKELAAEQGWKSE
jgi:hypothetical protein